MITIKGEVRFTQRARHVIFVLNILLTEISYGQLKEINSLGIVQQHSFPTPIHFSTFINYSSTKYPDIVFYSTDSSGIGILKNNGGGIFNTFTMIAHTANVTFITTGNLNNDNIDDIVVVHRDQNQVEILLSKKTDSSYTSNYLPVNFYPEKVVVGDITNDKIPDIISYGKLSTGICVLQGKGNGKFFLKKVLFENIPVGDFSIVALNADDIADVEVYNWLTNETTLFLGFGKMKFFEQTVLSFAQDSVQTLFGDFNDDALADIAVSSVQNKTVQIFHGDGLGNFSVVQTISTLLTPNKISMESFNTIGSDDILLNSNSTDVMSILINSGNGIFYDEIIFGKNHQASEAISGDINADGLADVIVIEQNGLGYSIFWNSKTVIPSFENEISIAVGLRPNNLTVTDLNDDGLDDIVVCNYESSTISFLLSTKNSFDGQVSIEVPGKPYSVSFYSKTDSTITFYTTHQENPQISLFTLKKGVDPSYSLVEDVEQFSIPLPEKPMTVLPDISYMQKGISLYAFMSTSTNAIVFYQQVKGTRFLAKNLVPKLQSKILYATISDLDNDAKTDLVYIYNDEKIKKAILGISMSDSIGEYKGQILQYIISDSLLRKAFIYFEDVSGDQIKDCLIFDSSNNTLRLSLGSRENILEQFEQISDSIKIRVPEQLLITDYDNDGINDILYIDKDSFDICMLRGKNNGKYFSVTKLKTLPKESTFRCGDFNGDSMIDIAYTNPDQNTISIVYGKKN
ncbi:MAG: VCBS repeat-containing protein [Bacteroidota bacterium]|nr:VCBS repeat-containing protein [Bacteroidota bacterium]